MTSSMNVLIDKRSRTVYKWAFIGIAWIGCIYCAANEGSFWLTICLFLFLIGITKIQIDEIVYMHCDHNRLTIKFNNILRKNKIYELSEIENIELIKSNNAVAPNTLRIKYNDNIFEEFNFTGNEKSISIFIDRMHEFGIEVNRRQDLF
jgi:hypothetical protein